ncbi:MAG: hypothetical protein EOP06_11925 [Proteobacteria bacterium]|nr:MAG: hypothetical protein EOP06_11925 [Pseudomonadota bacterium]
MKFRVWIFKFGLSSIMCALFLVPAFAQTNRNGNSESATGLVDVVSLLSEHVSGSKANCSADSLLDPKSATKPTSRLSNMMVCLQLSAYAESKKELKFNEEDPPNLCTTSELWPGGSPPWKTAASRVALAAHGTLSAVPATRASFVASGWKVRTASERDAYLESIETMRDRVATACCGPDQSCGSLMRSIKVMSCVSAADQNSALSDDCTLNNGVYDHTPEQNKALKEIVAGNKGVEVQVGTIILSPYVDAKGNPKAPFATVQHEFGHACSFIKKQIAAKKPETHPGFIAREWMDAWFNNACDAGEEVNRLAYGSMLSNTNLSAKVFECIAGLPQHSLNPSSSAYFEKSCPLRKMEEAMAEALSIAVTQPLVPNGFPTRFCGASPSRVHPAMADVFACAVKNDGRIRAQLSSAYSCGAGK